MSAGQIPAHYRAVDDRIRAACERAGRERESVRLIAVSKYRPPEQTRALYELGVRAFGENRVQEARDKIPQMPGDCEWHLIGPLQTNKAKYLPGLVQWVHSVERMKTANALQKAYEKEDARLKVLLQVNIAGEEQKSGCEPAEAEELVRGIAALDRLELRGLMTMAPYGDDPEETRPVFAELRALRDRVAEATGIALPELSMGMTNDFEVAIEEGATMVRVGTALYEGSG